MSRAFVSESDSDNDPGLPALKSPLPPGARNYMTAWGAAKLREEIDRVTLTERSEAAAAVAQARGSGGEGSRSDLKTAQYDMAMVERELEYLGELMRTSEVVESTRGPAERVAFGATVRVYDKMDQNEQIYQIVGVYESDPENGLISWVSPIARALKGKVVGETVAIALPGGERILKILSIVQQ